MQKLIVPELPSDDDIRDESNNSYYLSWKLDFSNGQKQMRDKHAAKHREAAVIAVEALESYGCSCFYLNDMSTNYETVKKTCIFCIASEKIKKIYEQKEK